MSDLPVSIHASAREATGSFCCPACRTNVSIHASAREATLPGRNHGQGKRVSIHASAREATQIQAIRQAGRLVSIHASAREATRRGWKMPRATPCFNPRLRTGGDALSPAPGFYQGRVSIHASAREATEIRQQLTYLENVSIHASAREATPQDTVGFPSTECFNPRLRTGGDVGVAVPVIGSAVSIHASAREATRARELFDTEFEAVSIHASAREATTSRWTSLPRSPCFNPRLRTGGDQPKPLAVAWYAVSIHASAREAT